MRVLLAAVLLDALVGEPPAAVHPVVWMGRALAALERRAPPTNVGRFGYGAVVGIGLPLAWGIAGWMVERLVPWPVQAVVLKSAFAGKALLSAAERVEDHLRTGQLDKARHELRSLVSRPTADLDGPLVAAAAIESLAENLVDSYLAPVTVYAAFGLGGVYAYRAANTADAMWGYRTPEYEWLGKVAARVDDALNWIPSRLGGALIALVGSRRGEAVRIWRRDAGLTSSPNAGQAMAACAGQLGVRLEKSGHYVLHAEAREPGVTDIACARKLIARAMMLTAVAALLTRAARRPGVRLR